MKKLMKKITVILVLMMMLINSSLLLIISNAVDAIEEIIDEAKINPLYEINLEKYVNYSTEDATGTVVQINLKTGIEYGEGQEYRPLNSTGVLLNLPKIEDEYPESIEVIGKSTKATNGSDEAKGIRYVYDKETGEMKLAVVNEKDDNGNIYSENVEGTRDEYTIICYYSSNCYNNKNIERNLEISGYVQTNIANDTELRKKTEITQNYIVTENISGLISTSIKTTDIYNGYINSNSQNGTNYATEYTENLEINISKKELTDEIKIDTTHSFIDKNDKETETNEIIYKSTKIDKNKVLDILGENGYLQILNENGDVLGEVNKDTEVEENGIYEVTYNDELNKVIIKTSKPLKVGTIVLQNTKEIKETMTNIENNRIQVKNNISCINNVKETSKIIDEDTNEEKEIVNEYTKEIYNFSNDNVVNIKDSETRVDLSIDKTEWTNNVQNDVTMTATLVTNDIKYNLFKSPVIEIKLPSEVEKVILGNVNLLYDENLNIKNAEVIEKDNCKIIKIEVEGTQNQYFNNSMLEGANIVISATVILKKDINSADINIESTYLNESGIINDYEKEGNSSKKYNIDISTINKIGTIKAISSQISEETSNENSLITVDDISMDVKAQVGDRVLSDGDAVYEGQIIKYQVTITNTTNRNIDGIKLTGQIPEGTVYGTLNIGNYIENAYDYIKDENKKEYEFSITSLKPGETRTEFYEVLVNNLSSNEIEKDISNSIVTEVNNELLYNNTIRNQIKKAELSVFLKSYIGRDENNSFHYFIYVRNLTNQAMENVTLYSTDFKKEMNLVEACYAESDDGIQHGDSIGEIKDGKYVANIDRIEPNEEKIIWLKVKLSNFEDNINEYDLRMALKAYEQEKIIYDSNENRRTAYPEYVTVVQTLDKEGEEVKYGETLNYHISIKNESKIRTTVNIIDYLPKELLGEEAKFEYYDFGEDYSTHYDIETEANTEYPKIATTLNINQAYVGENTKANFDFNTTIPAGKTLEIDFTAKANHVSEPTEVSNYVTVSGEYIHTKISNIVKCTIVPEKEPVIDPEDPETPVDPDDPDDPDEPDNPDNPDNPDEPGEDIYNISGIVWFDENENGKRDAETRFSGITVKLFDAENNTILKNEDGTSKVVVTNSNGEYRFSDIKKGKYLVLFEFATDKYDITKYHASGVEETFNSDVILKRVSIDGIEKDVAVTDIISVNSRDIVNIDMGLIEKSIYDLKLEKFVNKVTIKNGNGTKEYNYDNQKLVKVEIPAKQIDNTTIEIEYKIKITNEGNLGAYVTEITDYLPEGLKLKNSTIWTQKANGNVSTTTLSAKELLAGESTEIILIATKQLSSTSIGRIINSAEISSSLNEKDLNDRDSREGNKNTNEDDYSEAEIILSVKTGLVRNTLLIIGIIAILIMIFILLKKKNIKINNLFKIMIFIIGVSTITSSQVFAVNIKNTGSGEHGPFMGDDGNQYYCENPGFGMCRDGDHYYDLSSTEYGEWQYNGVVSEPSLYSDSSNVSFQASGNQYIVGPYKINSDTDLGTIEVSGEYEVRTPTGIETYSITSISKQMRGSKNCDIYFNVPINTIKITNVNVNVTFPDAKVISVYRIINMHYACSGISGPGTHSTPSGYHANMQGMRREGREDDTLTEDVTLSASFENQYYKGNLWIKKLDIDIGLRINGAKVTVSGPGYYQTDLTLTDGYILLTDMPVGNYTITETGAPDGYKLELQVSPCVTSGTTYVPNGGTAGVTLTNKQYGDLSLIKVDQTTFDKMNGVGFVIFKEEDGTRKYIRNYKYKENEPATVSWTTDVNSAMYFYTGIKGTTGSDGYTVGNCTNSDGMVLLKNLPVRNSSGDKIDYWAEEYKFDYDKNPDLIYYRLDKTKTVKTKLITNAYNKDSSDEHKISLMKRVTKEFYTSDYVKKMIKDKGASDIVQAIYQTIMNENPGTSFKNQYENSLNSSKTSEGYDTSVIGNMIDDIYNSDTNKTTLESRVSTIFNSDNNIKAYRDLLFSNIGIQGDDVKESMKDYCYYGLKSQTMVIMKNKQYTIDIRGYVWEDIATSKLTVRNDLYKDTIEDIKDCMATDVVVRLYAELNQQGQLPTLITTTDEDGYKFKGAEFVLDANGNKVLDANGDPKMQYNIIIDNLSSYYIEFEYNGLKYQNVLTEKEKYDPNNNNYIYSMENTSKAKEKDADRVNLNNSFATIIGGTSSTATDSNSGKTEGYSIDNNGNQTNKLIYDSKDHKSKLLSDEDKEYSVASVQNKIVPLGSSTGASIKADTGTAGCNFKDMYDLLPEGAREISNINLGIYERKQPDLAVATDIENIQFDINGYTHKYEYKNRNPYINNGVPDIEINPGYNAIFDGFSVGVKNDRTGEYNKPYTRQIYDSYIAYTKNDSSSENRLRVFVTYKLVVKNESGSLVSRVSLNNYADTRLENPESYYMNGDNKVSLTWTQVSNGIWQTGEIDKNISPTECMEIYLKYELNTNTIVSLASLGTNESLSIDHNVTEINSYSNWDTNGNIYGGIDNDSAPDNIIYDTISTYEDDTDAAPDLRFERKSSKEISGIVFEDSTNSNLQPGQERRGNGQYEDAEHKIENVDVKILNYAKNDNGENEPIKLYNLDSSGNVVITYAQDLTGGDGTYSFTGLVPGEYFIQYTYGYYNRVDLNNNTETNGLQTKVDSINITTESYKSTIVDSSRFETLIENNIENSNGYSVISNDYEVNKNAGTSQNALWYWYENPNNFSYSSAVDDKKLRQQINDSLNTINYNIKDNYDNKTDNQENHYMKAYTGIMDFAVEDYQDQITESDYVEGSRNYQIKFGIVERPRQSLQVNKEISNVRITLANGQILVEGDPRNETINYVTYPEGGTLKIEVDNEIIEGATLDLTYEITVDNRSELDYDALKYYRYGDRSGLSPVRIRLDYIVDYIDEKLSVTYDIDQPNSDFVYYNDSSDKTTDKWMLIVDPRKENKELTGVPIDSGVYDAIKNRNNIAMRNPNELYLSPIDNSTTQQDERRATFGLSAKKLLTDLNSTDQIFDNYTELIQVSNSVGRFYGQMANNEWKLRTPGNFNIKDSSTISSTDESDNSNYNRGNNIRNAKLTIVPPTGAGTIIAYCVIGLVCLVILSGGIILIKKKVLD